MPPGKSKEDTWKSKDLEKSLKEAKDERRRHKDKDRDRPRDKDRDRDRDRDHRKKEKDRHRDDDHKERRQRNKENDDRDHRDKPKHRDEDRKEKDRHRRDRDDREHRRDRHQRDEVKASNRKPKDDDDYYRMESKDHNYEDDDYERRRHRHHRTEDSGRSEHRHHRYRDEDEHERRERRHRNHEEDGERRRHREKDDRRDEQRSKHRDDAGHDRDRRKDKDDKDERRRHKDRDDDRRHRNHEEDKPRKHEDDEERRKRHEERKERKRREEKEREEKERLEKERIAKEKGNINRTSHPRAAWTDPLSPGGSTFRVANQFSPQVDQTTTAEYNEMQQNISNFSSPSDNAGMTDFQEALLKHYSLMNDSNNDSLVSYESARTAYEEVLIQKYKNNLTCEDFNTDSSEFDGRQSVMQNYAEIEPGGARISQSTHNLFQQRETPEEQVGFLDGNSENDAFNYGSDFEPYDGDFEPYDGDFEPYDGDFELPVDMTHKSNPGNGGGTNSHHEWFSNEETVMNEAANKKDSAKTLKTGSQVDIGKFKSQGAVSSKTHKLAPQGASSMKKMNTMVVSNVTSPSDRTLSRRRSSGSGIAQDKSQSLGNNNNLSAEKARSRNPDKKSPKTGVAHPAENQRRVSNTNPAESSSNNQVKKKSQRRSSFGEGQGHGSLTKQRGENLGRNEGASVYLATQRRPQRRAAQNKDNTVQVDKVTPSNKIIPSRSKVISQSSKPGIQRPAAQTSKNSSAQYQASVNPRRKTSTSKKTNVQKSPLNKVSEKSKGRNERLGSLDAVTRQPSIEEELGINKKKKINGKCKSSSTGTDTDGKLAGNKITEPIQAVRVEFETFERNTTSRLAVKGSPEDDIPVSLDGETVGTNRSDDSLVDFCDAKALSYLADVRPHPPRREGTPYFRYRMSENLSSYLCDDGFEEISEAENGDDNYDDDFEDYDDDFEDEDENNDAGDSSSDRDSESDDSSQRNNKDKKIKDDDELLLLSARGQHRPAGYYKSFNMDPTSPKFNGEMDEILDAMNKENERLLTESRRPNWSDQADEKSKRPVSNTKQTFINFVSAKQRQMSSKAMSKAARRGFELQEMIEFDVSEYDMFDMPPVTEYTMYMRSFGSSNTKQAYVQTNEDNIDRDLQTEEIEYSEKWTQQPPSEILACGGPDEKKSEDTDESIQSADMTHLSAFVERSAQVMTILLEEDFLDTLESKHSRSKQSNIIISDAFTEITIPGFLKERPIVYSHFSPVHTHMLLTLHATSNQPSSDPLTRQGCVCVWNVNEPTQPQKILMCESQPKCCCFSPTKTSLAFAGMSDGSVACWDTREASSLHKYHMHDDKSWLLRYPTYNTAGVLHYENHQSPVTAISTIVAPGERLRQFNTDDATASLSGLSQSESGEGLSFQLASLEENGIIHLWVVAELSHSDLAGSDSDYGLAPGGKVKLVKSSAIQLDSPVRDTRLRTTMKCSDLQLLPSNNSHYYVATDTGCVVHGLRYGGKAPPRAYRPLIENMVQVTTVDFSPFTEPVFLAGCKDGSLRLYHVDTEWPVMTWPLSTNGCPIKLVRWCRSRPTVFFVLDIESRLYIWDLLMDDSGPLKQESISKHRVTSLTLSNDYSATGFGMPGRRPQMVVCLENGSCEIHTMNQQFSALMADEVDQFAAFLQKNC